MTTGLDDILTAFVQRCTPVAQATGGVFEDRQAAFTKLEASAINITLRNADYTRLGGNTPARVVMRAQLEIELAVYTRADLDGAGNTVPMRLLGSPIWQAAHTALLSDPSLGGLASSLQLRRSDWQSQDADGAAGWAAHRYEVVCALWERDLSIVSNS